MSQKVRHEIQQLAESIFAVRRERLQAEWREKERIALHNASLTRNIGAYFPALIASVCGALKANILALADAYVNAFAAFDIPPDRSAEDALEQAAIEMAGSSRSRIMGEVELRHDRLRMHADHSDGGARELSRQQESALQEGKLRLGMARTQSKTLARVQASRPQESVLPQVRSIQSKIEVAQGGQLFAGKEFPRCMYHPTELPKVVSSKEEELELDGNWSRTYIHQTYPRVMYRRTGEQHTVNNEEEEKALGDEWGYMPNEFSSHQGAASAGKIDPDPLGGLDHWGLPGLSDRDRQRIKVKLTQHDVAFENAAKPNDVAINLMLVGFDDIAKILFDADLLRESILLNELTDLIWDVAISRKWLNYITDDPSSNLPQRRGHYWVLLNASRDWNNLFRGEVARWRLALQEHNRHEADDPVGLRDSKTPGSQADGDASAGESGRTAKVPTTRVKQINTDDLKKTVKKALSSRDQQINDVIGEARFLALTNSDIAKTNQFKQLLKQSNRTRSADAIKCCLDRIRSAMNYPLSRVVKKNRSTKST